MTGNEKTVGFGVPDTIDPHHFVVRVPSGSNGDIDIIEKFGLSSQTNEVDELLRCKLSRSAWSGIREEAKRVLNERLREKRLKSSRWSVGDNRIERLLGRELCLLAWSVEALQPHLIGAACASWSALKPEERWWLFRMCDNATGSYLDRDIGWRKAVRVAFSETPGPKTSPPKRMANKGVDPIDLFSLAKSKDLK